MFHNADVAHKEVLDGFREWKICIYCCFASAALEWVAQ